MCGLPVAVNPSIHLFLSFSLSLFLSFSLSVCVSVSHAPTATCQYHSSGNTSCALRCYVQEKCKYRSSGNPQSCCCRSSCWNWSFFLNHEPWFFLRSNLGNPNLTGLVAFDNSRQRSHASSIPSLCCSVESSTNVIAAACGRFHAVILQEASDHVPHISDQFIAKTGNTDLAILLNKDTFEPDPMVLAFRKLHKQRYLGTWFYSSFEHCCAAPHFRDINGHILLSTHSLCRCQET